MSSSATSHSFLRSCSTACGASAASPNAAPWNSSDRSALKPRRTIAWSSTMRTRMDGTVRAPSRLAVPIARSSDCSSAMMIFAPRAVEAFARSFARAFRIASTASRAADASKVATAAGTGHEIFQIGGAGADRRKPDRSSETAQSMGDLRERGDGPSRVQRRHFVNEDADGIALGGKRGHETLPHLVETLLQGCRRQKQGKRHRTQPRVLLRPVRAVGHVRALLEGNSY